MTAELFKSQVQTIDSLLVDQDSNTFLNLSIEELEHIDGGIIPIIIAVAIAAEFCEGVAIGAAIGSVVYSLSH